MGYQKPSRRFLAALLLGGLPIACSDDPLAPGAVLRVCHVSGNLGTPIEIPESDLPDHRSHGDYPVRLIVNGNTSVTGDSVHFTRIGDAIATARTIRLSRNELTSGACRILIEVGAGSFIGSVSEAANTAQERYPLVIDVPDITLRGSLRMQLDPGGRATGAGEGADVTTLIPDAGLLTVFVGGIPQNNRGEPLIVLNGHPEGSRGDRAVIEGFVFQSGNTAPDAVLGGHGIFAMRVTDIVIRGNRFETGFTEPIDLRVSSGLVERNYLTGRGGSCAICLSGPGSYEAKDNRLAGPGGIPGIFVNATGALPVPPAVEPFVLPAAVSLTATLTNNEVRNHQATPVGTGIRIGSVGPGSANVAGTTKVVASRNSLMNNRFGIIVDAAFPVANTTLRGDVDLTLNGNEMTGSCQNSILVSLSRHTTGLGLGTAPYLKNSVFVLSLGGDVALADVWYAHPPGLGNTLTIDGQVIANGSRSAYDPARTCT